MTRLVEILVGLNAALGIATWLSVRLARKKREQPRRMIEVAPRQLPPPPAELEQGEPREDDRGG